MLEEKFIWNIYSTCKTLIETPKSIDISKVEYSWRNTCVCICVCVAIMSFPSKYVEPPLDVATFL
mgnify:CR=1 FL=1